MDDDNYTFAVTPGLLDESDNFDAWLDKNGVQYVITNEYTNDSMTLMHADEDLIGPDMSRRLAEALGTANSETTGSGDDIVAKGDSKKLTKADLLEAYARRGQIYVEFLIIPDKPIDITFYTATDASTGSPPILPTHTLPESESATGTFSAQHQPLTPGARLPVTSFSAQPVAVNLPHLRLPSLRLQTGARLFLCARMECRAVFTRQPAARLHTLMEIGHKEYRCEHAGCKWAFYSRMKLKRHQETHLNRKDFQCTFPKCAKRFTTIYNLNIHKRIHERVANLNCPVLFCEEKFQTVRLREKHIKTNHRSSEAPFKCPQHDCPRTFFLTSGLTAHARTHAHRDDELRCQWPDCGRLFKQPSRLKEHSRRHTGSRPYVCVHGACTWTFATASKLKRHQITHTNERKFHCTIGTCTKSFLRSEHLREHTLTHIGQKAFQCGVCSTNFFGKSALLLHTKKAHTSDDKPTPTSPPPPLPPPTTTSAPTTTTTTTTTTAALDHLTPDSDLDDTTNALTVAIAASEEAQLAAIAHASELNETAARLRTAAAALKTSGESGLSSADLLEQAIQSLGVPSDMILGTGLLPEEPLDLLGSEHFSTVNLRDLE